jgi:hypothetical protein
MGCGVGAYDYKENKIVVVLSSDLETGVALNVVGHLAISLGAHIEVGLMGHPTLIDASGAAHRGISKYPLIIAKAKPNKVRAVLQSARTDRGLFVSDYPDAMLTTAHDDDLATALSKTREEEIRYLGVLLFGHTEKVDGLTRKLSLWK